jgi:hypothetical protein
MPSQTKQTVWVVEDNAHCSAREVIAGVTSRIKPDIVVTLHRISRGRPQAVAKLNYRPGSIPKKAQTGGRARLALALIRKAKAEAGVIVSGASYGSMHTFTDGVTKLGLDFLVQLKPGAKVALQAGRQLTFEPASGPISALTTGAAWKNAVIKHPHEDIKPTHLVADLGCGILGQTTRARLFAIARGGIKDGDRAIDYFATSLLDASVRRLLRPAGWVRWIRLAGRRNGHADASTAPSKPNPKPQPNGRHSPPKVVDLPVRANITISRQQSEGEAHRILLKNPHFPTEIWPFLPK